MSNYKNGVINLYFVGVKDGIYMYRNPTIDPPKEKPKNDDAKTIFEEVFGKKK